MKKRIGVLSSPFAIDCLELHLAEVDVSVLSAQGKDEGVIM